MSWVDFGLASVRRPIAVLLFRYERLVSLAGALLIVGELAYLDEPFSSYLLHAFLAFDGAEAVVEPLTAHISDEAGLSYAFRADEGEDVVIFNARLHHSRHGCGEVFTCHRSDELSVLNSEIVDEQSVKPSCSVPAQRLDVFTYRVAVNL